MNFLKYIIAQPRNTKYSEDCDAILSLENPFERSIKEGHITASGLVIKDGKVLLVFHPYIRRWIQPGGHVDNMEPPHEAAIREVYEETGLLCEIASKDLCPIDIDIHEIPANLKKGEGSHIHIDLLYRLTVLKQEKPIEDIRCAWFSFEDIESERIRRALANLSPQSL
ncbi:NUDIX hydrolase [Polynucleobacter necessarius]|uniref:NUDIX hydrolase n=1 Tax=Polynucleobacter necessarius TaxID=576610 RepID=UPI000E09C07F|nr:NUDIX domain-containing protein [Polynucleobacter necessarius]